MSTFPNVISTKAENIQDYSYQFGQGSMKLAYDERQDIIKRRKSYKY